MFSFVFLLWDNDKHRHQRHRWQSPGSLRTLITHGAEEKPYYSPETPPWKLCAHWSSFPRTKRSLQGLIQLAHLLTLTPDPNPSLSSSSYMPILSSKHPCNVLLRNRNRPHGPSLISAYDCCFIDTGGFSICYRKRISALAYAPLTPSAVFDNGAILTDGYWTEISPPCFGEHIWPSY